MLPFILAIILPSIDYFNNTDTGSSGEAFIRWVFISLTLLGIWYLNVFILEYKAITIIVINIFFIGLLILLSYMFYPDRFSPSVFPRIILPAILFVAIQQSLKSVQEKQLLLTENLQLKSETYKAELEMIAFVWCYKVGRHLHNNIKPIIIRKHGRKAKSIFKYGLSYIASILLNSESNDEIQIFEFLSCT